MSSSEFLNINGNKEMIKSILDSHGYKYKDMGEYLTCQAKFRGGDDDGSVAIYYKDSVVKDFVLGKTFKLNDFLQLVTEQKSQEELDKYLKGNNIELIEVDNAPKIKQVKKFDKSLLNYIDKSDISYIVGRGISEETSRLFECGMVGKVRGKLSQRFVWPIFNTNKTEVLGFSGRSLEKDAKKRYLCFGEKTSFVYPSHLNDKIIEKTKCVILTEGVPDLMRLFDTNLANSLCLFGTELSLSVLNYLLRKNVEKIVIVTNNEKDSLNGGVGNASAIKIYKKLLRYFDANSIKIHLPPKKDLMDCSRDELENWKKQLLLMVDSKYFAN